MSKKRIYQLATELNVTSKDLIEKLTELEIEVTSHMSTLEDSECELLIDLLGKDISTTEVTEILESEEIDENAIPVDSTMSVGEFAELLELKTSQVITTLMNQGIMATINQNIDFDAMVLIAEEYECSIKLRDETTVEKSYGLDFDDVEEDLKPRPPIVTVMGHVDHGKTSLLDAMRETDVTRGEAGGITQHIGASIIRVNDQKIVFLDTPGHEAFTSMRARGAQVTDVAILVVAADDGVMPQTIEAINHAKAAGVPIIVAINKMDKEGANPDRVMQELTEHGLMPESWGGEVITIPVSAHTKEGLDELLDMVLLVAEMQELKANPKRAAVGVIIEGELDKGKGSVATVLINKGTLKVGDIIVAGMASGKVRAMLDDKGNKVKKAGPSIPVAILGLSSVPDAGDILYAVKSEKIAREFAQRRTDLDRSVRLQNKKAVTLEDLFDQIKDGEIQDLNIIIKADVKGSIEAVKQSLLKLSNEEVRVNPIHGGVGAITEGDIMLASASNAIVIGFNVRPTNTALDIASREKVDVRTYRIIYKAIEDIEAAIKGMLKPEYKEVTLGRAEIRATFKVPNLGLIAGVYVQQGKITRKSKLRLLRENVVIHEGEVGSLRRFKDDVKELATGYEGGVSIEGYNDLKDGDVIEAYIMEEIER